MRSRRNFRVSEENGTRRWCGTFRPLGYCSSTIGITRRLSSPRAPHTCRHASPCHAQSRCYSTASKGAARLLCRRTAQQTRGLRVQHAKMMFSLEKQPLNGHQSCYCHGCYPPLADRTAPKAHLSSSPHLASPRARRSFRLHQANVSRSCVAIF